MPRGSSYLPRRINRIRWIRLVCKGCGDLILERRRWRPQPLNDFLKEFQVCPHCGRRLEPPRIPEDVAVDMDNDDEKVKK